jgi:hypothetical protein
LVLVFCFRFGFGFGIGIGVKAVSPLGDRKKENKGQKKDARKVNLFEQ